MVLKYFKPEEFDCPCCNQNRMKDIFLKKLDYARELAKVPFVINSGFRCEKHNKEVGGKDTSSHLKGFAVDIKCTNSTKRKKILKALIQVGFKRIGIAKTFIHVDLDNNKQDAVWTY